jgi:hypothetical protein
MSSFKANNPFIICGMFHNSKNLEIHFGIMSNSETEVIRVLSFIRNIHFGDRKKRLVL